MFEPLRKTYLYLSTRRVLFGVNAVKQVGLEAKQLSVGKNCLIVTDSGVVKAGLADRVVKPLKNEGFNVEVCDKAMPEPTLKSIVEIVDYAKKIEVNFVIGLGGGSSMDTAKLIAVAMTNPGDIKDYLTKNFSKPGIPCITIPTTAGTGAEVTWDAVVILSEERVKAFFEHPFIRPTVAIVDPLMSSTMPRNLTARTGIDALSHAIESTLTIKSFPLTEALALEAIRLISENLRRATYHGADLEARSNMALATLTAAFSETNAGDIEGHAAGHVIGAFYHIPHGIACGIALPYTMEYNLPVSPDMLARIAVAMGEDIKGLSTRETAYKGIYAVRHLIEDLGLPTTLKEVGDKKDLPKLVELFTTSPWITAFFDFCKRKTTKEDATKLFENMWEGKLGKP